MFSPVRCLTSITQLTVCVCLLSLPLSATQKTFMAASALDSASEASSSSRLWSGHSLGSILDGILAKLQSIGNGSLSGNSGLRAFSDAAAQWRMGKDSIIEDMEVQADDAIDIGHNFTKTRMRFRGGRNRFNGNNDLSIKIRTKNRKEKMAGFKEGSGMLKHGPIIGQVFRLEQTQYYETTADGRKRVDPFVMEMDYDQAEFETTTGLTELQELLAGCCYLGWLNIGVDAILDEFGDHLASINDKWVNAIQGNFANWDYFENLGVNRSDPLSLKEAGIIGLNMSYDAYLAGTTTIRGANTKQAGEFWVGDFGVDDNNNKMWAVVDHHSDFATVPEPAHYGLLLGVVAVLARVARRR